jgi:chromosome segregation ATPase
VNELKGARSALVKSLEDLRTEIDDLAAKGILLNKTVELFHFLLDRLIYSGVESISEIVTEGLKAIFHDQEIAFKGEISTKRNLTNVEFKTAQDGVEGPALEAFGGGVSSVESLILRLLVILKTGLARFVLLDESLAALSEQYDEAAATFIKQMCAKLNMDILLITHKPQYLDFADTAYQAEAQSDGTMKLKKIQ